MTNTKQLLMMAAGPAVIGVCIGLRSGSVLQSTLALPLTIIGVSMLMTPALYIGSAVIDAAPTLQETVSAMRHALGAMGLVFLGLAPALAFLVSSTSDIHTADLVAHGALAIGVFVGLRTLFARAAWPAARRAQAGLLFVLWSLLTIGIGSHLLHAQLGV